MSDDLLTAFNTTRNQPIASRMKWAGTSDTRRQGLLGRDSLDSGEGIYIVPCKWIHMFGMRFAIDAAFLDTSGRVVAIHEDLQPNRLSKIAWRAEGVLEVPAKALRASGTQVGDIIEFRETTQS